jgi:hypothetical protein
MDELQARRLMDEGIDPTSWLRQQADEGNHEPAFQPDFIPSEQFLRNQENLLRDPKEVERRISARQHVPRWAMDHYARTEGQRKKRKRNIEDINKERALRNERLDLPQYKKQELDEMPFLDLVAIARNYHVENLTPSTPRDVITRAVLEKQQLPSESFETVDLLVEEEAESTYIPEVADAPAPAPKRSAASPNEALEYDAQVQAEMAKAKAQRKDEEIQKYGPKAALAEAVGTGKPPEEAKE